MVDYFVFEQAQVINFPQAADRELFSELLKNYTHSLELKIKCDSKDFCISTGKFQKVDIGDFEYVINIASEGFYIGADSYFGVIHGFAALLEKIQYSKSDNTFKIECGTICEKPKIPFRCVHLCVFPETKLDFIKKCIRTCGIAKYSHIIIEFWGMLKFDCMKELSWPFAYTKEEAKSVINEAKSLGMEVIPMFNHLGHASACREVNGKHVVLDQNPIYEYLFNDFGWEWNFKDEEVYSLLREIRHELIELCGNGSYFHLGCDEAYSLGHGTNNGAELCEYLNRIEAELEAEGRRAIIWGDMLLDKEVFKNEPERYATNSEAEIVDTITSQLNKNIIIADWQYSLTCQQWKSAQILSSKGFDVICCPWDNIENAESAIDTVLSLNLYGIMHTTWHTLFKGFPSMVYSGMRSWNKSAYTLRKKEGWHYCASIARKVCPANGDYKKAGWSEKMTGPGL